MIDEPHLHVKLWIDGELVAEEDATLSNVDALANDHLEMVQRGDRPWTIEISDPDGDIPTVRFGSHEGLWSSR